jgi:23S rRNA (adenine2503-C2)-methyltransferase
MMLKTLSGLNTDELYALVQEHDAPRYRGKQLSEWVYRHGAHTLDEMISLPGDLRARLSTEYEVGRSHIEAIRHSRDGTFKLLLSLRDGSKVETVGIPYTDRLSCCLSTQAGCPVGCIFCATGQSSYIRNLTAGEMVDQVLTVQETARDRQLQSDKRSSRIDHVVFMGMGEPLLNYEATVKAIQLLNSEMGIAMRHLTVSTVGFVPGIYRLAQEKMQVTLAVSLHAPTDDLRRKLIPGMKKWSIAEIMDACNEYLKQTGRRVTLEYCLINGVNDGVSEAHELASLLHGLNCHVNLIPYNPVRELDFRASSRERVHAFREILEGAGIRVTRRVQRGSDIDSACGQLRQRTL